MSEPRTTERICPQCGLKTLESMCPQHGIPTLARVVGAIDTVQTGEIIGGRFRVDKLLGKGGFGAVFRATHVVTQQELVLKVLKPNLGEDENQVKRFLQEARTASKLSHPNTVRVYDFGQTDAGHLYMAMELLHGQELGQVLIDDGILPPERAIHIAIGVLKSLAEAHQAGLVHRDLKPDNIFLCKVHGEDDFVKVIDFGIAKPIDQGDDGGLTRTGFTVGTPKYMSPEQVLNKGVEGRSDLYALGVILYQCLSGELPLSGPSSVETMMAQVQQEPAALSLVCTQELPAGLEAVVMRALRKQPNQRFVDAEDMRAALEDVQEKAGMTGGRRARSAKLRAVTPLDLNETVAEPMLAAVASPPAPHLEIVRKEPTVPQTVTPHTEDGLTTTRQAGQPATEPPRTPPTHLDATLNLHAPPKTDAPVVVTSALKRRGAFVLPALLGSGAALLVAAGVWFAKNPSTQPTAAEAPAHGVATHAAVGEPVVPPAAVPLRAELAAAAVADLTGSVRACHPDGGTEALVQIDAKGRVTDVQLRKPPAAGAAETCVTDAIRKYRFAKADVPLRSALLAFAFEAQPVAPSTPAATAETKRSVPKVRKAAKPGAAKPNGDEAL